MKRTSTVKKQVESYLEDKDLSPLKFQDYEGKPGPSVAYSVDIMVERCLKLMELYNSRRITVPSIVTRNGRRRSSLDIWRHIIFFYPDVTILQVMKSLYNIQKKLRGNYCYDVQRRVFFLKEGNISSGLSEVTHQEHEDEYGLTFEDWNMKDIDTNSIPSLPF